MPAPDRTEKCPWCGITYGAFKTGYCYGDIFAMFWVDDEDPSTWANKRRRTVLGRWMQIKLEMWESHKRECEAHYRWAEANPEPEPEPEPESDPDEFLW